MRNRFHMTKPLAAALAAAIFVGAGLGGCTTATPYQPALSDKPSATGYSSQPLSDDQFRVSFAGNSMTSRETVENYLLYRAAELSREQGYDGFILIERETERDVDTRVSSFGAGRYSYWGPSWRYRRAGFGWSYWDPYYGDPFFNDNIDVRTVDSYEAFAVIKMYRGTRSDDRAFQADEVLRNLGPTIKRPN